jgi:hypothetical protein
MHSGNSAAINLTDGWRRLMKILTDTRPWKAARFIFPLKEDAPELSSVRRISSDRPGHLFLKRREFSQVSVSLLFWKVSLSGRKYFVGNGQKDFWEKILSNSSSSDARHVQVTRCVRGIFNFFIFRPRTRSFWGVSRPP